MENTLSVFVPFRITKKVDSTQNTKRMKILVKITLQPIREVFCYKSRILKFQTSVHKKFCMLFDTESQRSYIIDELRNYLKLTVLLKGHIFIKTFDKVEPTIKTVDIVQQKLSRTNKSVLIRVVCASFICSDILSQNIHSVASHYEHL